MLGRQPTTFAEVFEMLEASVRDPEEQLRGATDAELRALAVDLGFDLTQELTTWLRLCSGSTGGEGGLFGVGNNDSLNIESMYASYPGWKTRGWIPIAGDGCGDYYVIDTNQPGNPIGFVEPIVASDTIQYYAASGLLVFLRELLVKAASPTGWPFDQDYVVEVDPDLFRLAPLPWDA